jgi:4,5-DOPA dioxygenase extradiol
MSPDPLPTLFVSHGAPILPLEPIPARDFLSGLGSRYPDAKAILCISAHWETPHPAVSAIAEPETIHDFYGFPPELYRITYPARGAPDLAGHVASLVNAAGAGCDIDGDRGLDHGAWVPLMLMYPKAEVPVIQLSIQHSLDPRHHMQLGEAISPLRNEGVLVIGSGNAVHPLGDPYASLGEGAPTEGWAVEFDDWLAGAVTSGDQESLLQYRARAPHARRAHPRPDHYMPLLAAFGAAGPGAQGTVIHRSWQWGDLSMAAYEFR